MINKLQIASILYRNKIRFNTQFNTYSVNDVQQILLVVFPIPKWYNFIMKKRIKRSISEIYKYSYSTVKSKEFIKIIILPEGIESW